MEKYNDPNYNQIYSDIIQKQYPEKMAQCRELLMKSHLSAMEILDLNQRIFGKLEKINQKYRSYNKSDILQILDYQKRYNLNNKQLAIHFNISRNSVTKWKRFFL